MLDRLPFPLNRLLDCQRRRFFREEEWRVAGPAGPEAFTRVIETAADNRRAVRVLLGRAVGNA